MPKKPARRSYRTEIEPLERRALMADLKGVAFSVGSGPTARPGDTVRVDFVVANDSPFGVGPSHEVGFYVSRDGTVDRSDRLLKTGRFAPFMPAFYVTGVLTEFLTLPDASDPFWTGDGAYTLGMYLDRLDEVFEDNESNNADSSAGVDKATIQITGLTPPPDLVADGIAVSPATPARGDRITVDFNVRDLSNVGTSGRPVTVAVRLTTDGGSPRELGRVAVTAFTGGSVPANAGFDLPGKDDPIWSDGVSRRVVELVVDPDNQIAESDESNNGPRGLGTDRAAVDVRLTDFDPNALPESKHKPGSVLSQFLTMMNPWIGATIKEQQGYAKSWRGVSLAPSIQSLQGINAQIKTFANQLQPSIKSNGAPQVFTTTTTLDRAGLQMADRFILAFMTGRTGAGTVSASGSVSSKSEGKVRAAADDPWWSAGALKNLLANWYKNNKQGIDNAAAKYKADLAWLTAIVGLGSAGLGLTMWPAGVLAVTAAGAYARTYYLQQTAKATDRGDKGTVEEITRIDKRTTTGSVSITFNDDAPKNGKPLSPLSKTTETVTKYTIDTRSKTESAFDQILAAFDKIKADPVRNAPFQGTFNGNYESDSSFSSTGKNSGKMSIKFTNAPGSSALTGSGYIDQVTYNERGVEVGRTKNNFTFNGTATGTVFSGSVTFKASGKTYSIEGSVSGKTLTGYMGFSNLRYGAKKN